MNRPASILIVEDEPNFRLGFRTALESGPYTIATADDGEEALRWLRGHHADLVLLDLRLPGLDGLEVLRRLRDAGDDTPVVMVTAHGSTALVVETMKLGADNFVEKAVTPSELRRVVDATLVRSPKHPSRPRPEPLAALLDGARRALEHGDLARAEALCGVSTALAPDSAEVRRLEADLRSAREAAEGPYHLLRELLS
jgi:DNA-binding response OmpR family regulator